MPPKRPASSLSTPSPQKKPKTSHSQLKLEGFFKSPSQASPSAKPAVKGKAKEIIVIDDDDDVEADDSDLALALRLSRNEAAEAAIANSVAGKSPSVPPPSTSTPINAAFVAASPSASPSKAVRVLGHHAPAAELAWPDLTIDPLLFNVGTSSTWNTVRAPYSLLAHSLATLSATKSRILILNTLTNTLRLLIVHDPASVVPGVYLLSNTLSPVYISVELGIGSGIISKALQHVSGLTPAALRKLYTEKGDPGDVAFAAKSSLRTLVAHARLSVHGVYQSLLKIANAKGQGSAKQKQSLVEQLIVAAQGEEVRYLVRTLGQNLRVGAVRTTILTALARASSLHPSKNAANDAVSSSLYVDHSLLHDGVPFHPGKKSTQVSVAHETMRAHVRNCFAEAEAAVRSVYAKHPSYDDIVASILEFGLAGLDQRVDIAVGVPIQPALGTPTRALDEIYEKFGNATFTAELKLDGQRGQIHATRRDDAHATVKIFSRHLEDMTEKYPDIVMMVNEMFNTHAKLGSFIIDSEIVAIDKKTNTWRSFQELSNRARKDVQLSDIKVAVGVYCYDLMVLNGEALIHRSFRERRDLLRSTLPPFVPNSELAARFEHMASCDSDRGRDTVEAFWQDALGLKTEGFMCKLLDHSTISEQTSDVGGSIKSRRKPLLASYEPDKRTFSWLKLKQDYVDGLGDSLDLVPIGAWHGNGRKANWWSPILLAVMDSRKGKLVAVCKCMSGFSDDFYKALNERYPIDSDTCSRTSLWDVEAGGLRPTVFFRPSEVWEIKGADITVSPVSVAALGSVSADRGLSLRFPRFIRCREDKTIDEASGPQLLVTMFEAQKHKTKGGADDYDLVDVDWDREQDEDGEESETEL